MTAKICISIPPQTTSEALDLIKKAESQRADFIEVRLDYLKEYDRLRDIALCANTPLIATNKTTECQGRFSGSEAERQKTLRDAARHGFEYVDVDVSTPKLKSVIENYRELGAKSIVSFHDYNETPSVAQLKEILRKEVAGKSDVCKIVTTAKLVSDNLTVLDFLSKASRKDVKLVCFCMGELGKPSRLLSPIFGAFFTYASLESGKKTANGQLAVQEMRTAYDALGIQ